MNRLSILFALFVTTSFGQENKLAKFLGSGFQSIPTRKDIPCMETTPGFEIIPSLTLKGDTSGLVYQNEFLLFRNYQHTNQTGSERSYLKTTFVSNAEYLQFQNWVRDSIAREKIIEECNEPDFILKFIQTVEKDLEWDEADHNQRLNMLRKNHQLNWKAKLSYEDPELMPFLGSLYLPQPERFYKYRNFDRRVFKYSYSVLTADSIPIDFSTVVLGHSELWASKSTSINDEYAVLGQSYDRLLPNAPVIGLTGMQAHAFCHWKEVQLQRELDKKHLPYAVKVTLPLMKELTKVSAATLNVRANDYTVRWRITVEDYTSFLSAVKDSILMEKLFEELQNDKATRTDALKLIPYKEIYFNEINELRFEKVNPSDRDLCRFLYPLQKNPGIFKKYKERLLKIETELEGRLDVYKYYRLDIRSNAVIGKLVVDSTYFSDQPGRLHPLLKSEGRDSLTNEPIGMDNNFDYPNQLWQGTGVRTHSNYRRFFESKYIQLTPEIPLKDQQPEDPIKGITFEQALAYYHWKYPVWIAKSGDNWQGFVYPNEEQFKRVQNGEQIAIPEHNLNFPSPVFRYVVSFIRMK